jgi:hypothetical protein
MKLEALSHFPIGDERGSLLTYNFPYIHELNFLKNAKQLESKENNSFS